MIAYAEAATAFPERIAAVFLRSTAPASLSAAENQAIRAMRATGLAVYVGAVWDAGVDMVRALGLDPDGTVAAEVEEEVVTSPVVASPTALRPS